MQKLQVKGFALAFGIITAVWMLVIALIGMVSGWGSELVTLYGSLFVGYHASVGGAVAGAVWGFIYGGVFGALIAWLYNLLLR